MTLVYLSMREYLIAISDIVLSRPTEGTAPPVAIPTQPETLAFHRAGLSLSGVAQKMVVSGKTLLLWAGSVAIARTIISKAMIASSDGENEIDFPRLIDELGLSTAELNQVSIMYVFSGDARIQEWHLNAKQHDPPNGIEVVAGSGAWDFTSNLHVDYGAAQGDAATQLLWGSITKALLTVVSEALNQDNLNYLYGGWLEISIFERDKFHKLPYAIKFWEKDGDLVNLELPVFFSWYENSTLFVTRMDLRAGVPDYKAHQIPDFLGRDPITPPEARIRWEPRIVCHVVRTKGSDKTEIFMRKDMDEEFRLDLNGEKTIVCIEPELIGRILRGGADEPLRLRAAKPFET